jgi:hypothetical protein
MLLFEILGTGNKFLSHSRSVFSVLNALCFLHWNNKIFCSEMGVDGICFGGTIENLKAAINNREHCKESP